MEKAVKTNKLNWTNILENTSVADAYRRFATGQSTKTEIEREFKNTEYAGSFRALVRNGGTARAKVVARKALKRRSLV